MFEGKHIHFSPIDQKPLCSFSSKLCRQRRLNGFAFCIRHILEDPSAPFRVCTFVAPPGQNKCTNVISMGHPKGLCNTHLQLAGFPAAKRDRRNTSKKENSINLPVASSPNGKANCHSNEPTSSSMDMSDGDPYTFSDDAEPGLLNSTEPVNCGEDHKHKINSTEVHNSPLAIEPLTPSSTSSGSVDGHAEPNMCKKPLPASVPVVVANGLKLKAAKPETTRPKILPGIPTKKKKPLINPFKARLSQRLPTVLQQLDGSIRMNKGHSYILPPNRMDESDEDEQVPPLSGLSRHLLPALPLHPKAAFGTPRAIRLERSHKELRHRYSQLARMLHAEDKLRGEREVDAASKLVEAARRHPDETGLLLQGRDPFSAVSSLSSNLKIFSRKRCSFRRNTGHGDSDSGCQEFCLPCSTLCSRHILYSVDQQLFEFCSARGAGPTPCGAPVLAIHSGLPYCPAHLGQADRVGSATGSTFAASGGGVDTKTSCQDKNSFGGGQQSLTNPGSAMGKSANRRKARSRSTSSLGRHSRRLRNRRRAKRASDGGGGNGDVNETRIRCIEAADNGMELDVETVDSPENCSPAYPTPAQLIPHPNHASATTALSLPLSAQGGVDHEAEILEDQDLKELLNRLPDEAFQEIFAMTQAAASSSRNGGGIFVPSREEAEELERALAVEDVPMPIMDKYSGMGGVVGHGAESDLSDLSLIDDHALALAHDLMTMGAGAAAQNLLLGTSPAETVPVSVATGAASSSYMDNLSIPHPSMMHSGYSTEASASSLPPLSRRKSLPMIPSTQQPSPARGSSPPSLNQHHHHHDHHDGTLIEERGKSDGGSSIAAAAQPL